MVSPNLVGAVVIGGGQAGLCAGIHFIGFPWLSKRKSAIVFGVDEDARRIRAAILEHRAPI